MLSQATARYVRTVPQKTRFVVDLVRGKEAEEALWILENLNKRPTVYIRKLLISAIANATSKDKQLREKDLYISDVRVDQGPILYRFRAASMGRASRIRHRTSHIRIELDLTKAGKSRLETAGKRAKRSPEQSEGRAKTKKAKK